MSYICMIIYKTANTLINEQIITDEFCYKGTYKKHKFTLIWNLIP